MSYFDAPVHHTLGEAMMYLVNAETQAKRCALRSFELLLRCLRWHIGSGRAFKYVTMAIGAKVLSERKNPEQSSQSSEYANDYDVKLNLTAFFRISHLAQFSAKVTKAQNTAYNKRIGPSTAINSLGATENRKWISQLTIIQIPLPL